MTQMTVNYVYRYSTSCNVGRGVIQGDIISTVLFILVLDVLMQRYDFLCVCGKGFKCGYVLMFYANADDVVLMSFQTKWKT